MKNTIMSLLLLSSTIGFPVAKTSAQEVSPSTETQAPAIYTDQSVYFISSNSVRIRSTPSLTGRILGELSFNDKVKIVNPSVVYENNFIEITIVKTYDKLETSEKFFVNASFLSPKKIDYKEFVGKYFVVVNVASETLRLYERVCADNSCPNKMVFETEVVVGEDVNHPKEEKGKGRSILGSYRVIGWTKFYQDGEGHYPAWYRDGYPETPSFDASWSEWFSKKIMPIDEYGKRHGQMRGAFGWYTAFVEPEAFGQWTHGTLGWGSDKDKFIKKTKTTLINVVSNPRSSGCTRNNNEAIAFIRNMIEVGAPIIKIYAKEEILDPTLSSYPNSTKEWNYVLTKNKSHAVDRDAVLKSLGVSVEELNVFWEAKRSGGQLILDPKNPLNQVIESGTYIEDTRPDAITFTPGERMNKFNRKLGRKGNVYGVKDKAMHGTFYVDAGVLDGYAHPDEILEVSGFADEVTPPWMEASNLEGWN